MKRLRDDAQEVFLKTKKIENEQDQNIDSLQVTELGTVPKKMSGFMDYNKWMHSLSKKQMDFVKRELRGSERLEGAAGTGKTTTLVLRALFLCDEAQKKNEEFHAIFICHSVASKDYLKLMFESATLNQHILDSSYSQQSVTVTTLQEWCTEYLGNKIGRSEVLDEDAQESKELQFRFVSDAYSQCMDHDFVSYKDTCSQEFIKFIEDEDKSYVIEKLCSEISITIKGRAEQDYETYKELPRLQESIPVLEESDYLFVFLVYERYQNMLTDLGYFDNDDIPEILLIDQYGFYILTYSEGRVVAIPVGYGESYDYSEREGIILFSGVDSWYISKTVYKLENGEFMEILYASEPIFEDSGIEYQWREGDSNSESTAVTKEEYNAKWQEFINSHNFRYSLSKDYDSDRYEDFESSKDEKTKEEVIAYISGL